MRTRRAAVLLLAVTALAAGCGGGADGVVPHVAHFALGSDGPEARQYPLTPRPGVPDGVVLPEPATPPPLPDPEGDGHRPAPSPAPPPDPGGGPLVPGLEPTVAWADGGRYLAVVTVGSSSCPSGPHGIEVVADQELEIRLGPLLEGRAACTADLAGHVTVLDLPEGITPTRPLVARLEGLEVTLPAVGG